MITSGPSADPVHVSCRARSKPPGAEADVDERYVRAEFTGPLDGFGGRRGNADDIDPFALQHDPDDLAEAVVVVDDQAPDGHPLSLSAALLRRATAPARH